MSAPVSCCIVRVGNGAYISEAESLVPLEYDCPDEKRVKVVQKPAWRTPAFRR